MRPPTHMLVHQRQLSVEPKQTPRTGGKVHTKPAVAPVSRVCRVLIIAIIAWVLAETLVEAAYVRPWMAAVTHVHAEPHAHALHAHTMVHALAHAGPEPRRHALTHALAAHLLCVAHRSDVREAAEVALLAAVWGVEEGAWTRAATAEAL